jgi:hypothetical protein
MRPAITCRPIKDWLAQDSCVQKELTPPFRGFQRLTGNFIRFPSEIIYLRLPGLTLELHWTLIILVGETVGVAHLRGLDPHEFFPITWARWMDCLELQTVNAVRVRLAKLEAMGLIEVLPGRRGPSGSSPYRFRVRWEGSEEKVSAVFAKTLDTHEREVARMRRAKGGDGQAPSTPFPEGASSSRRIPRDVRLDEHPPRFVQTNPPPVFVQTNPPSLKEELKKKEEKKKNPSVSPSVFCLKKDRTDGLTEMDGEGSFDCSSWLRDVDSKPWPERLLEGLQEILEPGQVLALEGRSPWSAEGAWAIFQAIRSQTRLKTGERRITNVGGTA